jgi:pyridoxal phosphate enzyme (YggS family)
MSQVRSDLETNLEDVRKRMASAAARVGRDPDDVKLVAVTKGRSVDEVRAAYEKGLNVFGENRVQEGRAKIDELSDLPGVTWHMIGHIQSRKARDVVGAFQLVHSVDRLRIARKLDGDAGKNGLRQPVLIECNVSGESSKGGWPMDSESQWESRLPEFESLIALPNLEVRGLMTMAPWTKDRAVLEGVFGRLRRLSQFLADRLPSQPWSELSMGMTDDFEIAIEQGATMIRLGRAIFGDRESVSQV